MDGSQVSSSSCPVCLEDHIRTPVTSQCGHVVCGQCWVAMAERKDPLECCVCRARVTLLIPLYGMGGDGSASSDPVVAQWIARFNQSQSRESRQLWPAMQEDYQLVRRSFRSTISFRAAVFFSLAIVVAYCLSPLDLIPDSIPVVGLLDDALIVLAVFWLWHLLAEYERGFLFPRQGNL